MKHRRFISLLICTAVILAGSTALAVPAHAADEAADRCGCKEAEDHIVITKMYADEDDGITDYNIPEKINGLSDELLLRGLTG